MNCTICLRDLPLTKHHLVPVTRHKNKKTVKRHGKENLQNVIMVCRQCHNQLHVLISEKEMDSEFYTLEKLLNHEGVAKFTEWIRKRQPDKRVRVRRPRDYRR